MGKKIKEEQSEQQEVVDPIEDLKKDIKALANKMRAVGKLQVAAGKSERRYVYNAIKLEALINRKVF